MEQPDGRTPPLLARLAAAQYLFRGIQLGTTLGEAIYEIRRLRAAAKKPPEADDQSYANQPPPADAPADNPLTMSRGEMDAFFGAAGHRDG